MNGMIADFLGVGWRWPVAAENLATAVSGYEQRIRESILIILQTGKGERVMRPDFGCGIHELVFGTNDVTTSARIGFEVREALIAFEPRVELMDVRAAADPEEPARMLVEIAYRVRSTNNVFNLVYPFYLQQAGS